MGQDGGRWIVKDCSDDDQAGSICWRYSAGVSPKA